MKKMHICLMTMIVLCTFSLILIPGSLSQTGQVNEPQNIKVVNYSWYLDIYGNLIVVGQVQNIGQDVIDSVLLTGSATTFEQTQQGSWTKVWGNQLLPQQKAPFYMEFFTPESSYGSQGSWYGNVNEISIQVSLANATSSYQYQDLKISGDKGSVGTTGDFNGAYVVKGTLTNTGSQSASNITVVAAFFNSTGSVVGVGYTNYLSPRTLNPSESTTFQVAALDLNQSEVPTNLKITGYELLVQNEGPFQQGNTPIATPYTYAPGQNPVSTSNNNSNLLTYGAIAAVAVVIVVVVALLFLRKRSKPQSDVPEVAEPAQPSYKPKGTRRERK